MKKLLGPGAALWTAAALLALPASANAAEAFKAHTATGWSAQVPATWKLALKQKVSFEQQFGKHTFRSPNGNGVLKVTIRRDKGGAFAALAKANYEKLASRLMDAKVIREDKEVENGMEISSKVVSGHMVRTNFMREYTFGRVFVRDPKGKRLVTITLGMTHEKIEKFNEIFEKVMNSLKLHDPKPLDLSIPKAPALKAAGKKA